MKKKLFSVVMPVAVVLIASCIYLKNAQSDLYTDILCANVEVLAQGDENKPEPPKEDGLKVTGYWAPPVECSIYIPDPDPNKQGTTVKGRVPTCDKGGSLTRCPSCSF